MKVKTPKIVQARSRLSYFWSVLPLLVVVGVLLGWGDHIQFREPVDRVTPLRQQLAESEQQISSLESQRDRLREQLTAVERSSQIDRESVRQIREELQQSRLEYLAMEKELNLLRDVVGSSANSPGLYIQGFNVDRADGERSYRLRFTVSQALKNDGYAEGWIRVALEGERSGEREVLPLSELTTDKQERLKMRFRHFQDVDGLIQIPESFVPERVIVEIEPNTDKIPGMTQAFDWLVIR